MHQTALTRRGRKQFRQGSQQAVMPIGHDQIDLRRPSCAHILQEAQPSLLAFLGTRSQCENLFVAFQIHAQGGQNDRGIGFFPMPNAEMHAIEVEHSPMRLQRTLSPRLILVGEALVEPTDRAGDFERLP